MRGASSADLTGLGRCARRRRPGCERPARPGVPRPRGLAEHARRQASLARRPARQGRDRRLLDLFVHQLPPHASASEGVGQGVSPRGADDRGRPRAGVRLRARPLATCARPSSGSASPGPSRSTTTSRRGGRTRTTTGRRSTSSTGPAACATAHFGEGAYDETESWIRRLLGEKVEDAAHLCGRRDAERHHDAGVVPRLRTPRPLRRPGDLRPRKAPYRFPARPGPGRARVLGPLDGSLPSTPAPETTHACGSGSRRTTSSSCSQAKDAWRCSSTGVR